MVSVEPELASARDAQGVSALMRARYRLEPALVDAVMSGAPALDVFDAAAIADVDRLRQLLDGDPSLATVFSGDGFTALHFPAFFGGVDPARLLLERGADVDAHGRGWMTGTPLNSAASGRHTDVARLLLDAGADPDARQASGWTPLHSAAHNGRPRTRRAAARARSGPRRGERRRCDRAVHGRGGWERGRRRPRPCRAGLLTAYRISRRTRTPARPSRTGSRGRT